MFLSIQIGNAVPPPMGRAIGLEIKKCLALKEKEDRESKEGMGEEENKPVKSVCEEKEAKEEDTVSQSEGWSSSGS